MSNGTYLKSKEGLEARRQLIEGINDNYDEVIQNILDPQPEINLEDNPLFAAGIRGLERFKWDYLGAQEVAAELQAKQA